jgi:hypothetical protein
LKWALENPDAQRRAEKIASRGRTVPEHLVAPPVLPGFEGWMSDFHDLSSDRMFGQVVGPVPKASVDRHVAGWPPGEAATFRAAVHAMDDVYLGHLRRGGAPEEPESDNPARDALDAAFGVTKP